MSYIDHFPILASAVTGDILISAFASLVCMPIGITSSAVQLKQVSVQQLQNLKGISQ